MFESVWCSNIDVRVCLISNFANLMMVILCLMSFRTFSHSQKLGVQVWLLIDESIQVCLMFEKWCSSWLNEYHYLQFTFGFPTANRVSNRYFLKIKFHICNHPPDKYKKVGSDYLVESDPQVISFLEPFIKRVFKGQSSSSSSIRFWKVVQFCWAIANILLGLLLLLLSSTKLVVISGAHCCTKWDYNILLVCVAILKGIISSTL